eukprot:scaffold332641_cov44-Prasinocladus_malaysianus.AAC.1
MSPTSANEPLSPTSALMAEVKASAPFPASGNPYPVQAQQRLYEDARAYLACQGVKPQPSPTPVPVDAPAAASGAPKPAAARPASATSKRTTLSKKPVKGKGGLGVKKMATK